MRVIIITSSSNRSGGTRQSLYQAKGLADRGHDVTLCLPADSTFWELEPDPLWHRLPENASQWRAAVERLLPDDPSTPTIVHAYHNKAVKLVAWWGLFWRKRNLACVAHRGVLFRPHNPLPYISPAMRAFLVNSEACAKAISLYTPKRKIRLIRNAVPDERVTPTTDAETVRRSLGLETADPCFAYIGNNTPLKGADVLLRAFAEAKLPRAGLIMIGTEPDRWNGLGEELGIAHQVRHLGHVEQVSDYLQLADAFVFPTSLDSAPNTLIEAVRMGLPVVATNVGGVPEIVRGNGILAPPGNPAELARTLAGALRDMAENPEQRAAWAAVSRELGRGYSLDARCDALEAAFASLVRT